MATLARSNRTAEVVQQVAEMPATQFAGFLEDLTAEARGLLDVLTLGADEAFEVMLAQLLTVLTRRAGQLFEITAPDIRPPGPSLVTGARRFGEVFAAWRRR
jgi:hypothetical protein